MIALLAQFARWLWSLNVLELIGLMTVGCVLSLTALIVGCFVAMETEGRKVERERRRRDRQEEERERNEAWAFEYERLKAWRHEQETIRLVIEDSKHWETA